MATSSSMSPHPSSSSQPVDTDQPKSPDYGPIEPEPDTTFYFESDHLALKANVDYLKLLKHVALLEVQRKLIIQDLEFYYDLENQVTLSSKPTEIARKIANKEMTVPPKRRIAKRPTIDWTKYNIQASSQNVKPGLSKGTTSEILQSTSKAEIVVPSPNQTLNVTKPETFNKPWSAEEQIRLEELLLKYPPEKSDSDRFRKIAKELGNRTLQQVCSRVQKYYKKMRRLGKKTAPYTSRKKTRKEARILHKQNKMLVRESTFLPALSVQMDNKIFMDRSSSEEESGEDTGREEDKSPMERSTTEQWLRILERIKRDKGSEEEMRSVVHTDLQCYVCKEQPILGTRWHCLSCSCNDTSLNLCNDCTVLQLHSPTAARVHPLHHLMHPYPLLGFHTVTSDGQPLDLNYLPSSAFTSTSYLDPNRRTEY